MKTRLLFVWPSAEFSTWDVARGYREAIDRHGGFDVHDYRLSARIRYHATALGEQRAENLNLLTRMASDNVVVEAMRHRADLVFIVSGMALHPDAIWLLRRAGIPTAVLFTESPYNDQEQHEFYAVYPEMIGFTNERTSATNGWTYVPHAYDARVHRPAEPTIPPCDVLLLGTLWQDRIALLERVDWTGIDVRLFGTWVAPPAPEDSSIGRYFTPGCVRNVDAPGYYAAAKICLNPHRAHPTAESLNPRAYELAACGAFQLIDRRAEGHDVFGPTVRTFAGAEHLEDVLRYWLARDAERGDHAAAARRRVAPHTFDDRLETVLRNLDGIV